MQKDLIDLLINASPMLLLIAVWIFFMLALRRRTSKQNEAAAANTAAILANTEALERVSALLEKRASEPRN
jgi:large-conductance mechanosensitive channel